MSLKKYIFIYGVWPAKGGVKVGEFMDAAGISHSGDGEYQLRQTWSECRMELFDPDFSPDIKDIEQYRAFCPAWELWARSINGSQISFRLILTGEVLSPGTKKGLNGINPGQYKITAPVSRASVKLRFPLWGKPILMDRGYMWYTSQIPRLLDYPVEYAGDPTLKRVFLQVEKLLDDNGYIDLVRYTGLEVSR